MSTEIVNNLKIMSLRPYNKSSEPLYESAYISKPVITTSPERPSKNLLPSISSRERRRRRREMLYSSSDGEDQENREMNKETRKSPMKANSGHEHYHDHKTPQEGESKMFKMAASKSSRRRKIRKQRKLFSSSDTDTNGEEDGRNW